MTEAQSSIGPGARLLAYLQLFRLPNVFTAVADVLMGYLVTHARVEAPGVLALLVGASCLLYTAGMVLNDVYDRQVDAQERPERPLPSGRIRPGVAWLLVLEMLLIGTALGWLAGYFSGQLRPGLVATALTGCVWLYDAVLKRTPLAPVAMGACRLLNVLLGMSVASGPWLPVHYLIAAGIGIYIAGVTWFARTEARESSRAQLALAAVIILGGISLLALWPMILPKEAWQLAVPPRLWYVLWLLLGLTIAHRLVRAILQPQPEAVQPAVKLCILSLIALDAAIVYGWHGQGGPGLPWVLVVLLLLVPAMFLGKWIYST